MDDLKSTKTPTTVYLDLSKAFDTLNYDIFFSKLEFYDISEILLALIKSFLINRFQSVQYENMISELLDGSFHAKSPKKSKILTLTSSILLKIGI